jgi:Holliday junction resolvase
VAQTPENKVKNHVKRILSKYPCTYSFMPATHGYGASGVPDIVACINGKFIAVECKANGGKPTALQKRNLHQIVAAGGHAFVVDEESTGVLAMMLDTVAFLNGEPKLHDFTEEEPSENK